MAISLTISLKTRIGLDIGGTKIEGILLDSRGLVQTRKRIHTPKNDYPGLLDAIESLVAELSEPGSNADHADAPYAKDLLHTDNQGIAVSERQSIGVVSSCTIGLGTPGTVSSKTGKMKNCNNTCLNGQSLREDLIERLGCEVRLANDADCFTLSESIDGAASNSPVVFGVILGTGVGGGLCVNGRLVDGVNSITGEWGHNPLPLFSYSIFPGQTIAKPQQGKRLCYCGHFDCVETWLSGPGFEKSYQHAGGAKIPAQDIIERLHKGEDLAAQVFHQYCVLLALALSTVINILDPYIVVLGGGMSNVDELYEEVPKYLPTYVFSDQVNTSLLKAKHGDSSGVRGAAWLWPDH